jgi:hypothetical protein
MIDYATALPKNPPLFITWSSASRVSREAAARAWVGAAKQAGLNPRIVQQSLSSDDAGEWHITTLKGDHPGQIPDELWDEVFLILEAGGDVVHDTKLKCWHGAVLLDDASQFAIALRLRLARRALNLSAESFYAPIPREVRETLCERGFSEDDLSKLCDCHGIPEEWLTSGEPAELETPARK